MHKTQEQQRLEAVITGGGPEPESVGAAFSRRLRLAIGDQPVFRFAQRCGISDSLIRKYLEGSMPGLEKLIMIARAADVRVGWLATGELPVRECGEAAGLRVANTLQARYAGEFALIPWYEAQCDSAADQSPDERMAERLAFRRDWLLGEGLAPEGLVLVCAGGDSMVPTVADGDLLMVDTRERDLAEDAIYVLRLDHHVVAKRLQVDWKGGLWVRSDNPQYADQHISTEDAAELNIVGRVVWMARRI
ncbi:phage repressor protein C with HTH and peptisase S24 domain [Alkalispirillum mobile]|uniref:Phage repressor protein C with HTH and peptisase S24 domain n=1 Tax=Alkalispirillum mobile TaxID=85925 RepID=A0A498CCA0_9GAMM|nr:LexA family transcriptional regulator [Alkalispirillum mobile]RLK50860.1 phage repressor protein C with HTH and peptisase S24 domain [Alkalispirillum mobile]